MAIEIHESFPRYTDFDPRVPVWCVTPGEGRTIHRFFDTPPFSPSGRYLALLRLPFEDRLPAPGDAAEVVLVDLHAGAERVLTTTRGWEPQMGANINWGADDHALFYNDVDVSDWSCFAVRLDPLTGEKRRLGGTVYQASPDGRHLASADMRAMRRTQAGYGVMVPDELVPRRVGPRDDDGLWITDTETGEARLVASIAKIVRDATPAVEMDDPSKYEIYGFHAKWNPQGDRLLFTLRWYADPGESLFGAMGRGGHRTLKFTVFTLRPDGTEICSAVGKSEWDKGGHHINFFPDGRRLSMNLSIERRGLRFVQCNLDGTDLRKILESPPGSGHPTVHPDGRHILADCYAHGQMAFDDGTTPLRWVDVQTGEDRHLVRFPALSPHRETHGALRVDPHPAWDRSWRWVAFNAYLGGTRRVLVADLASVIGE